MKCRPDATTLKFRRYVVGIALALLLPASVAMIAWAHIARPQLPFYCFAPTPPMGWNSYDAFGDTVTENEVLANARYVQEKLLSHGWNYIVIDFRWYDPEPPGNDFLLNKLRTGAKLPADDFGRLLPAGNRFPSSAGGKGFKPLADRLHKMGLKFGVHSMRGIPREAVLAKTPIADSEFTAADAGDPGRPGEWCPDMFGVRSNAAGQAWYDSLFKQYAAARDLWQHKNLGTFDSRLALQVPAHGAVLLKLSLPSK
jgi:alpha-galactosidase